MLHFSFLFFSIITTPRQQLVDYQGIGMSIFKTKTETEMPVASPHLIGGQSPEHDKENNPV